MVLPITVIDILLYAFDTITPMLFVSLFNGVQIKHNRKLLIFTAALFLSCLAIYFFKYTLGPTEIQYVLNILILFVGVLIYSLLSNKKLSILRRIVPSFLYQISFITANIFTSIIITVAYRCYDLVGTMLDRTYQSTVYLPIYIIFLCLFLLMSTLLCQKAKTFKLSSKIFWWLMMLPILSSLSILFFPIVSSISYSSNLIGYYYIALVIITLFSTIGIYYLIYQMWLKNKIEKEKELYQSMLKMETKRYEDIKNSSNQIRKIRHDIKNMLFSVKAEIDENNIDEAHIKLDAILDNVNSIGSVIESENRTIDYIVNAKLGNIENRTIAVSGNISGMSKISDVDISIILGNILDNAVEATNNTENANINLLFFIKGNYQNILCKNTVKHSVLQNNPHLNTNKNQKDSHGFGIKSVKEVVESYDGSINFFEENNMFCVHIMLPL